METNRLNGDNKEQRTKFSSYRKWKTCILRDKNNAQLATGMKWKFGVAIGGMT